MYPEDAETTAKTPTYPEDAETTAKTLTYPETQKQHTVILASKPKKEIMTYQISASGPPALLESSLVCQAIDTALCNPDMNKWERKELSAAILHMGHCRTFDSMLSVATHALSKVPKSRPKQRQAAIAILKPLTDEARRLEK